MKNLARCLFMIFLIGISSSLYAQEWVAYQQYVQPVYAPPQPQPVIVYQWIPYTVQQNVIVEKRCFLHINQTVVTRPTVQWVLQPVVIYR